MNRNKKNRGNQDGGNSWTSYSDLFTSLAVVFLVMFVFALIKAAVNNVKMAKSKKETEEYLEGKVPKKLKQEMAKKEAIIEKSIEDIDQYDNIIDQKLIGLNNLVKNLSKQKKIMKDLLNDKKEKEVILKEVNDSIVTKNNKIKQLDKVVKQYEVQNKQILDQKKTLSIKLANYEKQVTSLKSERTLQQESLKFFETQNNKKKEKIEQAKMVLSAQESQLTKIQELYKQTKIAIERKTKKIESLTKNNNSVQNDLNQMSKDLQNQKSALAAATSSMESSQQKAGKQSQLIKTLQGQIGDLKGQFNQLKGEYASAKNGLESQNKALGGQIEGLQGQLSGLGSKHKGLKGKLGDLKGQLGGMQGKYNSAMAATKQCVKEKSYVQSKFNKLAKTEKAVRKIASVQESIRENIAENLAKRFRDANLPVVVDKRTGNIVFQMDDLFLFKNNSAELTGNIKEKLNQIMPIYADELLGRADIAQHILRINIEGHASPTFKKSFVDPLNADPEAYGYNLELSTKRATQLVQYIFGTEIQEFPFQSKMRVMTNAVGYSFSQAIKKSHITEICGQYDCPKSRRVIISFTLNNNQMIIEAFEKQKRISSNFK